MRRFVENGMLLAICFSMTGCGGCGGASESVMRRASQRRSAPDNLEPVTKTQDTKNAASSDTPESSRAAPPGAPAALDVSAVPAAGATGSQAPPGPVVSNEKPKEPLTEVERRARSIANLEKIGRALTAYTKKKGTFPPQASSVDGDAHFSWRVLILPELGYPELRNRFKNEPWDSPYNKLLLDYIPPEYQSAERFDVKTNYLAVVGRSSVFRDDFEGRSLAALRDGVDNSLAVVEVDDKYAQEWTRPADHAATLELPGDKLGGLRGEGTFGILANGRVVLLPREMPPSRLAALFTVDGGEPIGAASFLAPPTAEPPPPTLATIADDPAAANQPAPAESLASANAPGSATAAFPGFAAKAAEPAKEEVPDEQSLAKARELLKELYGEQFRQARKPEDQKEFLKKLLDNAENVEQNPADYHELVRIARDLAATLGDVPLALVACELLEQRFQVDSMAMRLAVLESVNRRVGELENADPGLKEAQRLCREAFEADRYEIALPTCEVALSFARIKGDKGETTKLQRQASALEAARSLYIAAQKGFETIQINPGDAMAQESVGRYVCLVKNRWDAGLPHLSKAADIRLRGIASIELAPNRSIHETMSLAEQCWELASQFKPPQRRGLHLRAVYCYGLVEPKLATSLEKVKAQRRIDEAITLYGREEIDRILAPLAPKKGPDSLSAN